VVYGGNTINTSSTSTALTQKVVKPQSTTTVLKSSLNPSVVGNPVLLTATVLTPVLSPLSGGIVTFKNGTTVLGTGTLSYVPASLTYTVTLNVLSLLVGTNNLTAVFKGNTANYRVPQRYSLKQLTQQ
jgi:hypothetical protein